MSSTTIIIFNYIGATPAPSATLGTIRLRSSSSTLTTKLSKS